MTDIPAFLLGLIWDLFTHLPEFWDLWLQVTWSPIAALSLPWACEKRNSHSLWPFSPSICASDRRHRSWPVPLPLFRLPLLGVRAGQLHPGLQLLSHLVRWTRPASPPTVCLAVADLWAKCLWWLPGSSPSRIQGNPQDEWCRRMRERVRPSSGLSLKFIFARPLYTLNNIFGGSAYCLHTGHLKTLQQLDLQQKQDVTHIFFVHKSLSYHLAFRPANILWLAPGVM